MSDSLLDKAMFTIDPGVKKELPDLKKDGKVDDLSITLSNKRELSLHQLLNNGPVLLVFIRGTWCPFCRLYLSKLRKWAEMLKGKNATILIVSTESPEVLTEWLKNNPMNYLFASDIGYTLAQYFGVILQKNDHSQAATFVIDVDHQITLAYSGNRSSKNRDKIIEAV